MLSVIYAECHLCWVSFMLSVIYAECHLCCVSFMLSVIYAECYLCWVSFMLCHLCWGVQISQFCWVSLGWMSLCWMSWRHFSPFLPLRHSETSSPAKTGSIKLFYRSKLPNNIVSWCVRHCQTLLLHVRKGMGYTRLGFTRHVSSRLVACTLKIFWASYDEHHEWHLYYKCSLGTYCILSGIMHRQV